MKINDIITNRLILKNMTSDDVEFLAELWNEPEVGKYLNVPRYKNPDELKEILGQIDDWEDEFTFIAYDKIRNKPIGTCSVAAQGPAGSWGFGYDLTRELWGNGYGTEMANAMIDFIYSLGVRSLYCIVARENLASCRVMEKCGLKATSISTFKNYRDNVVLESIIYRMYLD